MTNAISNMDDIIDIRDVIERFEELESEQETLQSDYNDALQSFNESEEGTKEADELNNAADSARGALDDWNNSDEAEEMRTLTALLDECKGNGGDEQWRGDWYPVTLIHESYFEQAMDEMIEECYGDQYTKDLPSFMTLTLDYEALKQDYTEVDFDGVTYYVR